MKKQLIERPRHLYYMTTEVAIMVGVPYELVRLLAPVMKIPRIGHHYMWTMKNVKKLKTFINSCSDNIIYEL